MKTLVGIMLLLGPPANAAPSGTDLARGSEQMTPASQRPPLQIERVSRPPTLEDFLTEGSTEVGTRVSEFRQRSPHDGSPISAETSAYLSYDDKNLYVVFVCKQNPRDVRAHMSRREDIDQDDSVTVFLDTFHDHRRAYVLSTNPLGVQRDGVITEGQDIDYSFDTLWSSEGRLTADGYVVRMAIPFKSLRFREEPEQTWGIGLGRSIVHTGEDAYWPYVTDRIEGFVPQLAPLAGPEGVLSLRHLLLVPYAAASTSRVLDTAAPGFQMDHRGRAGLDAKIILNNAFTWDLALNPDFSEVESDDPQVLVNQRFQVFFPEKRPFFLDNAAFFQTPELLFFSRHVAHPEFAGRLTGKARRWAFGGLISDDRAPGDQAPTTTATRSRAVVGALRVQREIGKESTIGVLATTRDLSPTFNHVVAVDLRLKWSDTWVFTGQGVESFDRKLNGARVDGSAYLANLSRAGRHFVFVSSYLDRSPTFNAPLGFIQRVDIRQTQNHAGYSWRPDKSPVLAFGPSVTASADWSHHGTLQDWSGVADWSVSLKGPSEFKVSRAEYFELIQEQQLRQHSTLGSFYTTPTRWMSFSVSYNQGIGANYSPPAGILPFVGNVREVNVDLTLRPRSRFRVDETYLYSEMTGPLSSQAPTRVYINHITRSKAHYQFTRSLSLRAIVDYNSLLPNRLQAAREESKHLTGDILLTYLANPGKAIYFGYNNQFDNLTIQPTTPPTLARTRWPSMSIGWQFYAKISYVLRQ